MSFRISFVSKISKMALIIAGALIAEFVILEETVGVSIPSDRYRAESRAEIRVEGRETHYITENNRFTLIESSNANHEAIDVVLLEQFSMDKAPDLEGPPSASVSVTAMVDRKVKWKFRESGERGDVMTDNLYRVIKGSNGEAPGYYTYFSLRDGRKIRTFRADLTLAELAALDGSVAAAR